MLIKTEDSKVNFIDKNDMYVGFDTMQSCCEYADWFLSKDKSVTTTDYNYPSGNMGINYKGFYFIPKEPEDVSKQHSLDEGCMLTFELTNDAGDLLYLHIFNSHNGYYGHTLLTNVSGTEEEYSL